MEANSNNCVVESSRRVFVEDDFLEEKNDRHRSLVGFKQLPSKERLGLIAKFLLRREPCSIQYKGLPSIASIDGMHNQLKPFVFCKADDLVRHLPNGAHILPDHLIVARYIDHNHDPNVLIDDPSSFPNKTLTKYVLMVRVKLDKRAVLVFALSEEVWDNFLEHGRQHIRGMALGGTKSFASTEEVKVEFVRFGRLHSAAAKNRLEDVVQADHDSFVTLWNESTAKLESNASKVERPVLTGSSLNGACSFDEDTNNENTSNENTILGSDPSTDDDQMKKELVRLQEKVKMLQLQNGDLQQEIGELRGILQLHEDDPQQPFNKLSKLTEMFGHAASAVHKFNELLNSANGPEQCKDALHPILHHHLVTLERLKSRAKDMLSELSDELIEFQGSNRETEFQSLVKQQQSQYNYFKVKLKKVKKLLAAFKDQLPSVPHSATLLSLAFPNLDSEEQFDGLKTLAICAKAERCIDLSERLGNNIEVPVRIFTELRGFDEYVRGGRASTVFVRSYHRVLVVLEQFELSRARCDWESCQAILVELAKYAADISFNWTLEEACYHDLVNSISPDVYRFVLSPSFAAFRMMGAGDGRLDALHSTISCILESIPETDAVTSDTDGDGVSGSGEDHNDSDEGDLSGSDEENDDEDDSINPFLIDCDSLPNLDVDFLGDSN